MVDDSVGTFCEVGSGFATSFATSKHCDLQTHSNGDSFHVLLSQSILSTSIFNLLEAETVQWSGRFMCEVADAILFTRGNLPC